jgi:hypothetical protein
MHTYKRNESDAISRGKLLPRLSNEPPKRPPPSSQPTPLYAYVTVRPDGCLAWRNHRSISPPTRASRSCNNTFSFTSALPLTSSFHVLRIHSCHPQAPAKPPQFCPSETDFPAITFLDGGAMSRCSASLLLHLLGEHPHIGLPLCEAAPLFEGRVSPSAE